MNLHLVNSGPDMLLLLLKALQNLVNGQVEKRIKKKPLFFMITLHLLEQDFGQGLNQMELFQVTIAKTGRLGIILIMQHWAKVINFTIF